MAVPPFDANSQKRIAKAVRAYETHRRDNRVPGPAHRPITAGGDLPAPQYQYQFIGGVSQNQIGCLFIPAHSMISGVDGTE